MLLQRETGCLLNNAYRFPSIFNAERSLNMIEKPSDFPNIRHLNATYEKRIRQIPFLNIDSLLIPTPYEKHRTLDIDYQNSYVWDEEGELLGYLLVYSNDGKSDFHIYKQVTSPFGRGKGIGSAFLEKLTSSVPPTHIFTSMSGKS